MWAKFYQEMLGQYLKAYMQINLIDSCAVSLHMFCINGSSISFRYSIF